MSGVGKGIVASSIAKILQARGLKVTAIKIDPYVNVDAGTMNPTEHGEVFVLDDGTECDQDMGNYERFLNCDLSGLNYMTTGSIYLSVINRERSLGYNVKCVEVVPQIPLEVIRRIKDAVNKARANFAIVEIGGTVGEYQNVLFLETIRMLKQNRPKDVILVLVSYLPAIGKDGELKTKPTQYAVRGLNAVGLHPDLILARAQVPLDKKRKEKIAINCNMQNEDIISDPDLENIYEAPISFEKNNLSRIISGKLNIKTKTGNLNAWRNYVNAARKLSREVKIGIVGKYFDTGDFVLADSYISVIEAVKHAAFAVGVKPRIEWISSPQFDGTKKIVAGNLKKLKNCGRIIVPGGFGSRGAEGKIAVIKYCRENKIPYLGLCYGMQLAIVEFCRSVCCLKKANTTEIDSKTSAPVIDILEEQKANIARSNYGATMRLGVYPAMVKPGTIARRAYKKELISERHRHRHEVNPKYIKKIESGGMIFSGTSPDGKLMEIVELPEKIHPFFVGSQFHPELKSRPLRPNPLFLEFIKKASGR